MAESEMIVGLGAFAGLANRLRGCCTPSLRNGAFRAIRWSSIDSRGSAAGVRRSRNGAGLTNRSCRKRNHRSERKCYLPSPRRKGFLAGDTNLRHLKRYLAPCAASYSRGDRAIEPLLLNCTLDCTPKHVVGGGKIEPSIRKNLVPEMPHSSKDHGGVQSVRCSNDFRVSYRSARLDYRRSACF